LANMIVDKELALRFYNNEHISTNLDPGYKLNTISFSQSSSIILLKKEQDDLFSISH
ncbi:35483_t:CDS:1, partial [Racocetra persica]